MSSSINDFFSTFIWQSRVLKTSKVFRIPKLQTFQACWDTLFDMSKKSSTILEKMAQAEAEREEHRRLQDDKDRQFRLTMEAIERENSHKLADAKKSMAMHSALNKKIELKRKEERLRQVTRETASDELKERLASTFHNLELNSRQDNLEAWCQECGCIHTSDVVEAEEHD